MESFGKKAAPYLYILPACFFLSMFTYFPVVRSFWLSFFDLSLASPQMRFVSLYNYIDALSRPLFWKVIRNNLVYALGTVLPSLFFALWLAILVNRKLREVGFYRFSLFHPNMIPTASAALIWLWLYAPGYGLINIVLRILGFPSIQWLETENLALPALIIMAIWKYLGYYTILFLAGLQNIPNELYEVATTEGATSWKKFRYITLPLLSPTTFFVCIIAIINSFQSVDQVYIMTRGGPNNATNVVLYYIYQEGFLYWNTSFAATLSTMLFIILLILTVIYFKIIGRWVYYR